MASDPLALRQGNRRETSHRKPRQENSRGGRRNLGHTGEEGQSCNVTQAQGLSAPTLETGTHPESKWKDASAGDSDDERQSYASAIPVSSGTSRRNHWRPEL